MLDASYARQIGMLAYQALLEEVDLEGKPGLVCPGSSGAHHDMDCALFQKSAHVLRPYFVSCALAGMRSTKERISTLLPRLRPLGIEAEKAMYLATGGINTHKGAIFSMGLATAAAGHVIAMTQSKRIDKPTISSARLSAMIKKTMMTIAGPVASRELPSAPASAGVRQYRKFGVTGARGQAQSGYPIVFEHLLPFLMQRDGPERRLDALLYSISRLDDTCILSRGGPEGLAFMQRRALDVLICGGAESALGSASLARFCSESKRHGLSPGGSADMLALAIFLRSAIHYMQRVHAMPIPQGVFR